MSKYSREKNIYFITFSYYPSGIFVSQIIDVIKLLRELSGKRVRLVSFFSVRNYFKCRAWVKKYMPDAIVLPILFGMKKWSWHSFILKFFVKKDDWFIGRNPMGAAIALNYSKNVIYDGRSALKGEIIEYDMALNAHLNQSMMNAEKRAVKDSKFRIAISNNLVEFWKNEFNYQGKENTVIHCSLGYSHNNPLISRDKNEHTKLIFSGGGSPWQRQDKKYEWLEDILKNSTIEVTFLSKTNDQIRKLQKLHPDRVIQKFVPPEQVFEELNKADYGILLRENNLTNNVASPVKFAEYLNAGLKVIISASVKDYSQFTREHECGIVLEDMNSQLSLNPLSQK